MGQRPDRRLLATGAVLLTLLIFVAGTVALVGMVWKCAVLP